MNARRKITKIVGISLSAAAVAVGLTACGSKDSEKEKPVETTEYTVTFNTDGGSAVNSKIVASGGKVTKPTDPTKDGYTFGGWLLNGQPFDFNSAITGNITLTAKWEVQGYSITYVINGHGTQPAVGSGSKLPDTLPVLEESGFVFGGWYLDEALTTIATAGATISANTTLYAKWEAEASESTIKYSVNFEELIAQGNADLTESVKIGNVTLSKGVTPAGDGTGVGDKDGNKYKRIKNIKGDAVIDGTTCTSLPTKQYMEIEVGGAGKVVLYYAPGGTSGRNLYVINKDTMEVLHNIPNEGSSQATTLEVTVEEATTLVVCASNGHNFYGVETEYEGSLGEEVGISITSNGTEKYLAGDKVDLSGLKVVANYSSGATIDLKKDEYTVEVTDSSNQKLNLDNPFTAAGQYTLTVKYKNFDTKSFTVNVYDLGKIELGFNKIEKLSSNSTAGNGQYFNQTVQQVYGLEDTLDMDALSIRAYSSDESFDKLINLDSSAVSFSTVDMTTAGEKTITVTVTLNGITKTAEYKVYVVDTAIKTVTENNQTTAYVYVDKNYTGVVGAVNNVPEVSKECNTFKTVQQALDYLGMQDSTLNSARKMIYLAQGTYNEKIEITLPYVQIVGLAGAEKTIIEWDSLVGLTDETGYGHTTDSTATVAIRDTAVNCIIDGVTISNYYNSIDKYTGAFATSGERGLAVLAQADQLIIQNSRLLGWQDTLELFTGRQYIKDTYICGTVDYIFGTNNATYFEGCTIETLKSKPAYTSNDQVSAYVTAFKGQNKGTSDVIRYGAIFDDCNFITSDDFIGKVAIARPWTATSSVAFINSRFSSKFATKESEAISNGLTKNVNVETLIIKLYNNTLLDGTTAFTIVDDTLDNVNCNMTETEAANYTKENIFAKANGSVTFEAAWDPEVVTIEVNNNVYYNFTTATNPTGTNYNVDQKLSLSSTSEPYVLGGITLDSSKGNIAFNSGSGHTNFKSGAKMTLHVEAGTSIFIDTYSASYNQFEINGFRFSTETFTKYFAEATDVTIVSYGDAYLGQIIVNPNAEEPSTELELSDLTVEKTPVDPIAVNTEYDLSEIVVKANYSDGSYRVLSATEYTTDAGSVIDITVAAEYTVTVTYNDDNSKTTTFKVVYTDVVSDTYEEDAKFTGIEALSTSLVTKNNLSSNNHSDGTSIQITAGSISFKVNKNAVVTIKGYDSNYGYLLINGESNNSQDYVVNATEDATVITIAFDPANPSKCYLKSVEIKYIPTVSESKAISFKGGTYTQNVTGVTTEATSTIVDATENYAIVFDTLRLEGCKSNNSATNWLTITSSTVITFKVTGACKVVIYYYDANSVGTVAFNGETVTANNSFSDQKTAVEYTITGAGTVTFNSSTNGYIGCIGVIYPSAE